jgi:putative FmdB family regulatory protein
MPTYEYRCRECGEHLEVVQSFADDPLTECPACSGPLRKVFNSVGIAFKGSGFYKNDSRSGSKTTASGSSSGSSSDGSSGTASESTSDSKSSSSSSSSSDSSSSSAAATSTA